MTHGFAVANCSRSRQTGGAPTRARFKYGDALGDTNRKPRPFGCPR